jgi:tRNA(Arg) A34 adenosine deaminase TadA
VLEPLLARSTAVKPVAAVLIGPEGGLLGASWNTSSTDKSAHAEYNLMRGFLLSGGRIPAGSTLLVSLRPCALCAGVILTASDDMGGIRVRFLEEDPGPASKNSCLMPHSDLWRRAGSPTVDVAWLSVP